MSKSKKPHSEYRWCIKYTRNKDGTSFFGAMLTRSRDALPNVDSDAYAYRKVRVLVTEITKRKAKR